MICSRCHTPFNIIPISKGEEIYCSNCSLLLYKNENNSIIILNEYKNSLDETADEQALRDRINKEKEHRFKELLERKEKEIEFKKRIEKERIEKEKVEKLQQEKILAEQEKLYQQQLKEEKILQEKLQVIQAEKERIELERLNLQATQKKQQEELYSSSLQQQLEAEYKQQQNILLEQLQKERQEKEQLIINEQKRITEEQEQLKLLEIERNKKFKLLVDQLEKERKEKEELENNLLQNKKLIKDKEFELQQTLEQNKNMQQAQENVQQQSTDYLLQNQFLEKQLKNERQQNALLQEKLLARNDFKTRKIDKKKSNNALKWVLPILTITLLSIAFFKYRNRFFQFTKQSKTPTVLANTDTNFTPINIAQLNADTTLLNTLKQNIIQHGILSWNKINLSDIQAFSILDYQKMASEERYKVDIQLEDKSKTKAHAELLIMLSDSTQNISTSNITYSNIAPKNAWFGFAPIPNCTISINTNNNPILLKKCATCPTQAINSNAETPTNIDTSESLFIKSTNQYDASVDFTYVPIQQNL